MKKIAIFKHNLLRATLTLALIVTCAAAWAQTTESVTYIDADGTEKTVTATVLTGSETVSYGSIDLAAGWYVVKSNISYTNQIGGSTYSGSTYTGTGTINIILADGAEMTVNVSGAVAIQLTSYFPLAIYGQSAGTGRLTVTCDRDAISPHGGITINGGIVSATGTDSNSCGIYADDAAITINGGQVTATPGYNVSGIFTSGTITLGGGTVTAYGGYGGTVAVALPDGYAYSDGSGNFYANGTLTDAQKSAIAGKTLNVAPDPAHFSVSGDEYTIHTAAGWGVFCDALQDNNTYNRFSGKTVKLDADIEVSRMAGSSYHDFTGTFNGQGKTLTFTYNATEAYAAPFRYVEGPSATNHAAIQNLNVISTVTGTNCRHLSGLIGLSGSNVDVSNCNVEVHITSYKGADDNQMYPSGLMSQCTGSVSISGCTVTGEIATNGKYAAGILGIVQGSATIATITNCVSSVTINSSTAGDGTHGGFVAVSYPGSTTIEGCLFNGKLLTVNTGETATGNCGGFVGWRTTGTVTISNSLYAPADLGDGETEVVTGTGDYPSATFVRNGNANTITNCYYTEALGTPQGTQAYSITADENVTVNYAGTPTNTYATSGIATYATGIKCNDVLYASSGDNVSLTLDNNPPTGLDFINYTVSPEGTPFTGSGNHYTLTMPDADVEIGATFELLPGTVPYLDMNGQQRYCINSTPLTSNMITIGTASQETWYVADGTINFTNKITVQGDVHLILKDGAMMNVGTESTPAPDTAISANRHSISIYAQSTGANKGQLHVYGSIFGIYAVKGGAVNIGGGKVTATGTGRYGICADSNSRPSPGSVTISGGEVTAMGGDIGIIAYRNNSSVTISGGQVKAIGGSYGIQANKGPVTISGGQVTATGIRQYGIYALITEVTISGGQVTATGGTIGIHADATNSYSGSVTLGWTNATDFIYANSYGITTSTHGNNSGSISIASGKTFVTEDDTTYSSGTLNSEQLAALAGKTLYPQGVVFKEVAGYGEGTGGWVFIASPLAGSIAPSEVHNLLGSYDEATGKYDYDLYRFNQSADLEWQNYHSHTDDFNLVNGQGYLYATKYTKKLAFGGTFITSNEPVEVPLDYDADQPLAGWNLVGNPFTVEATMTDGDNNPVSYYVISGQTVVPYEGTETTIEPFTGVMVKAERTGESVYFTKVSSNAAPQPNNGSLHIALTQVPEPVEGPTRNQTGVSTSSTTLLDNAIVSFNEGSQLGKFYFGEQNGNIYIPQGAEEYAIAYSDGYGEMPVNFRANENGQYTISVNPEGVEMSYLHLIDNMTGADVDLLAAKVPELVEGPTSNNGVSTGSTTSYTFNAKTTDYESRFKLVFVANGEDGPSTGSGTFAFYSNGNWIIANDGDATLQVIDLNGRILSSESIHGSVSKSIDAAAGVYMLRLINGDEVKTQKIVVR